MGRLWRRSTKIQVRRSSKIQNFEIDLDKERVSLGIKQLTKDTSAKDILVGK